jgi:maleate cis-trans isomerase
MRVGSEMSCAPLVGFISPPAWYDPSPTEFRAIAVDEVRVQQYVLPLQNFDWRLEEVSETELDQILAAQTLGDVGCDVIATVGTPFAWAGLRTADDARARCARLTAASGVPNVMAGIAILDALNVLGARKVGLACTYYSEYLARPVEIVRGGVRLRSVSGTQSRRPWSGTSAGRGES